MIMIKMIKNDQNRDAVDSHAFVTDYDYCYDYCLVYNSIEYIR